MIIKNGRPAKNDIYRLPDGRFLFRVLEAKRKEITIQAYDSKMIYSDITFCAPIKACIDNELFNPKNCVYNEVTGETIVTRMGAIV